MFCLPDLLFRAIFGRIHHSGHPKSRSRFAAEQGHRLAKPRAYLTFFRKCHISSRLRTRTSLDTSGLGTVNASARTHLKTLTSLIRETTSNRAKAHISHRIKRHGQGFYCFRLATGGRVREVAPPGRTKIPLMATDKATLDVIGRVAFLAAKIAHCRLLGFLQSKGVTRQMVPYILW